MELRIATLQETLGKAQAYDIGFGEVHATSGQNKSLPGHGDGGDWAIMSISHPAIVAQNKHTRSSGSFLYFEHPQLDRIGLDFITEAETHFAPGPQFGLVRDHPLNCNEIVLKPRSRATSKWVAETFSETWSVERVNGCITQEWCFVSLSDSPMSAPGDSGSIILDQKFRPVGILWGGQMREFAYGPRDVTYASLVSAVFRDIEYRMHWNEGSVSLA